MIVTFRTVDEFEGWDKFPAFIEQVIASQSSKRVCEIGAGANPAISQDAVRKHVLQFRAVDEVETELLKSGMTETGMTQTYDVCAPDAPVPGAPYDLIFSRMTAEHFRAPDHAYKNMFQAGLFSDTTIIPSGCRCCIG
ncbi:hypothetical protein SBA2_260085 [Acidobacteriia bacterium SbA2]|nr:hypothetical protein SBA2_260085 [Acidobacteriia bacterium SbA2]